MNITIDFDPADTHDQRSLLRLTELVTGKSLTAEATKPEPEPDKPAKPSAKEIRDAIAKADTLEELKAVEDQYGKCFTQAQRKAYSARVEKLTPAPPTDGTPWEGQDAPEPTQEAKAQGDEAVAEPVPTEPTLETAVKRASELLGSGQVDRVKAALAGLDAPRVSKLKPNQVQAFLDALEG